MNDDAAKKYSSLSELVQNFIDQNIDGNNTPDSWLEIVGENLAGRSSLIDIKNDTMIIEVDHPAVAQDIMLHKKQILEKLAGKYPNLNITKIRTTLKRCYAQYTQQTKKTKTGKKPQVIQKNHTGNIKLNAELPDALQSIFEKIKAHADRTEKDKF